ncbi:hypothetical protein CUMW_285830 [Citrus unshiu]|uniref:Bifunctional inhibitor/plant lipid transfer protein/seed storage helical domain-containing protein n=1 Tax=Citrus unshiu TaxID=55188 RepID=A0A2H5N1T8_CITUN|nr:hypothetical protein CUMW_285830 [Citrus unshiu]
MGRQYISIYFFLIFLSHCLSQIPLFRIPCRSGKCTTPVEVTPFQLIISEVFPGICSQGFSIPWSLCKCYNERQKHS